MEPRKQSELEKRLNSPEWFTNGDVVLAAIRESKNQLEDIFSSYLPAARAHLKNIPDRLPLDLIARIFIFVENGIAEKKFRAEEVNLRLYNMLSKEGAKEKSATPAVEFFRETVFHEIKFNEKNPKKETYSSERILTCLHQFEYARQKEYLPQNIFDAFKMSTKERIDAQKIRQKITEYFIRTQHIEALKLWSKWELQDDAFPQTYVEGVCNVLNTDYLDVLKFTGEFPKDPGDEKIKSYQAMFSESMRKTEAGQLAIEFFYDLNVLRNISASSNLPNLWQSRDSYLQKLDDMALHFVSEFNNKYGVFADGTTIKDITAPKIALEDKLYLRGILQTIAMQANYHKMHSLKIPPQGLTSVFRSPRVISGNTPPIDWFRYAVESGPHPLAYLELAKLEKNPDRQFDSFAKAIECLPHSGKYHLNPLDVSISIIKVLLEKPPANNETAEKINNILLSLIQFHLINDNINCLNTLLCEMPERQHIENRLETVPPDQRIKIYLEIILSLSKIMNVIGEEKENLTQTFTYYSLRLLATLNAQEKNYSVKNSEDVATFENVKKNLPKIAFRMAAFHLGYATEEKESKENINPEKAKQWLMFIAKFPNGMDYFKSAFEAGDKRAIRMLLLIQTDPFLKHHLGSVHVPPEVMSDPLKRLNARFDRLFMTLTSHRQFIYGSKTDMLNNIVRIKLLVTDKKWDEALKIFHENDLKNIDTKWSAPNPRTGRTTFTSDLTELKKEIAQLSKQSHTPSLDFKSRASRKS